MVTIKDCECGKRCMTGMDKCASCLQLERKAAKIEPSDNNSTINKMSHKTAKTNSRYLTRLKSWKRGKKCEAHFVHDCSDHITCHHMFGRGNHYHDEWAEENDVPLTLDERFWKPLCLNAHAYITDHPKFAHENGYTYLRIAESTNLKSRN